MYIERSLTQLIQKLSQASPIVMLTGPRQAGKTTLLRSIAPDRRFVTLDDLELRQLAQKDPKSFLDRFPPPVTIDEFQYAPEILPYLKIAVDEKRTRLKECAGEYWLTGSQNFSMMENVQESLAGRVMIAHLLGFNRKEIQKDLSWNEHFLTQPGRPFETKQSALDLWKMITKGDKPEVWVNKKMDMEIFYRSYVQTYIERDVLSQVKVRDIGLFERFFRVLATRSGQILNYHSLANELDVSSVTIKHWISILERSFQIFILPVYYQNIGKRILKSPKLYFLDTGLLCYFYKLFDPRQAMESPFAGALFETWVMTEMIKYFWYQGKAADLYYWRTKEGKEVDILFSQAGTVYPMEIKLSASPKTDLFRSFENYCQKEKINVGHKKILCPSKITLPQDDSTSIVSVWDIG